MNEFGSALQRLRPAIEIDLAVNSDSIQGRLAAALERCSLLGVAGVTVPATVKAELTTLKAEWQSFEGPGTIRKWAAQLSDDESLAVARQIVAWLHFTEDAT